MAAWRRFVSCVRSLPEHEAAPLWQAALAEARLAYMLASAVTTGTIMTITAVAAHGMDARLTGPSRAASVSRIVMVHGTTDTDGTAKHGE
jgi:hypothetical protein